MKPSILSVSIALIATFSLFSAQGQIIKTFAGNGSAGYSGDGGQATAAEVYYPSGSAVDGSGNVYFADYSNHVIRKVNPFGIISTIAGNLFPGYSGDGGPATAASLYYPTDVACDASGNLYIADAGNNRIRKVSGGVITRVAGGLPGFGGDGFPATSIAVQLDEPTGIAFDAAGNLFIADQANSRVRKIDATSGIVSTVAGSGSWGYAGDGSPATAAAMERPSDVAIDGAGNIYITDYSNHTVRKVNTGGIISTIAGNTIAGYSGDGGAATAAEINGPVGIAVDGVRNVYIGDKGNHRIRMVNTSGIISTKAGTGTAGYSGDGGPASAAALNTPHYPMVDAMRNLFVADAINMRLRKIQLYNGYPYFINGPRSNISVCANSTFNPLSTLLTIYDINVSITETWSAIGTAAHGTVAASYSGAATGGLLTPSGLSYAPTAGYSGPDSFKVRITNGTVSDTIAVYVTVNPAPVVGSISGSSVVCVGSTITLTNPTPGGAWSATTGIATVAGGVVAGTAAGTGSVQYTVTLGSCSTSVSHPITVNPLPDAGTIAGPGVVCVGNSITLTDAAPGGTWTASNGNATVTGGIVTAVTSGVVTIIYKTTNSCGTDSATAVVTIFSTDSCYLTGVLSVNDNPGTAIVTPNPASDKITIAANGMYLSAAIIDEAGKVVMTININAGRSVVDIHALSAGLYYITLYGEKGNVTRKLIKK